MVENATAIIEVADETVILSLSSGVLDLAVTQLRSTLFISKHGEKITMRPFASQIWLISTVLSQEKQLNVSFTSFVDDLCTTVASHTDRRYAKSNSKQS